MDTTTMSQDFQLDQDIIAEAQAGSIAAFERILAVYEHAIFGYLYRHVSRREDAEDLVQETFLKVYKNLKKLDPSKSLKSWIFTIATNTLYDYLRKKRISREFLAFEELPEPAETKEPIDAYIDYGGGKELDLTAALEAIEPRYATILKLYYFHGFTYDELAEILAIPINTVKTHLYRAKQALADELEL